jgi:CHRD domain/PEP-CTERM motif
VLRIHQILAPAILLLLAGVNGNADILLHANITNNQENPPATPLLTADGLPRPTSFGTADFILSSDMTSMTMTATIFNIDVTGSQTADTNDDLRAAHIHAAPLGTNGGVVWGFFGAPLNDNNPADVVLTPFATSVGGMFTAKWDQPEGNNTTLTDQLSNILSNGTYINFHTAQFGGGEIRGQNNVVPEPSTVALSALGGLALFISRLRRK